MAAHNELGKKGEALALTWLTGHNYRVLHQNWRHSRMEVDIIAEKEMVLHFIEVKCRSNHEFGYPEESVNRKKIQNLLNAADEYLYQYPQWKRIQFDVLSIQVKNENETEFFLIEDVYL